MINTLEEEGVGRKGFKEQVIVELRLEGCDAGTFLAKENSLCKRTRCDWIWGTASNNYSGAQNILGSQMSFLWYK